MNARIVLKTNEKMASIARRIEEATLNATAVREQLLYDGWLLRFANEPAKHMRSIHVIGPAQVTPDIDTRLARCEHLYRQKGLPLTLRLTELGDEPALDQALAARGYVRGDETLVMIRELDVPFEQVDPVGAPCKPMALAQFSETLGRLKNSPEAHIQAHARRMDILAADARARTITRMGEPIAVGLAVLEDELVGVFDMAVATRHRRKGWGGLLVCQLMADAAARGARYAYLQVDASNQAACKLYHSMGFQNFYTYWYRCAPQKALGKHKKTAQAAVESEG